MKNTIVIGIMAFTISVVGCGKKSGTSHSSTSPTRAPIDFVGDQQKRVTRSQVVAYAIADTNNAPNIVLTVSEIWKGAHEAPTLGITNGTQFSLQWSTNDGLVGPWPDAAIVIIPPATNSSVALKMRSLTFIRAGQIDSMTLQEYKTKVGL